MHVNVVFCFAHSFNKRHLNRGFILSFFNPTAGEENCSAHLTIMKNIQDCHNAIKRGSPKGILEKFTCTPAVCATKNKNINKDPSTPEA